MEIPELVQLLRSKIEMKIDDFNKLEKEKGTMQKEIVTTLQSLEELLKQNFNILNDSRPIHDLKKDK